MTFGLARERALRTALLILLLVLTLSTAILMITVNHLVPSADGMLGHDYGYFFPYLLSGVQWAYRNGWLAIPYFTPDYCGGIPWLANPQSMFYSAPQLLTVFDRSNHCG
jgi:hypothetical protein